MTWTPLYAPAYTFQVDACKTEFLHWMNCSLQVGIPYQDTVFNFHRKLTNWASYWWFFYYLPASLAAFKSFREQYPRLKIFLSFGGSDVSEMVDMASSLQGRRTFSQSALHSLRVGGFDGLDLYYKDTLSVNRKLSSAGLTALIAVRKF